MSFCLFNFRGQFRGSQNSLDTTTLVASCGNMNAGQLSSAKMAQVASQTVSRQGRRRRTNLLPTHLISYVHILGAFLFFSAYIFLKTKPNATDSCTAATSAADVKSIKAGAEGRVFVCLSAATELMTKQDK